MNYSPWGHNSQTQLKQLSLHTIETLLMGKETLDQGSLSQLVQGELKALPTTASLLEHSFSDTYLAFFPQQKQKSLEVKRQLKQFEQTRRDSEKQGSLACCSPWGQSQT